jgi:hypothetical protein
MADGRRKAASGRSQDGNARRTEGNGYWSKGDGRRTGGNARRPRALSHEVGEIDRPPATEIGSKGINPGEGSESGTAHGAHVAGCPLSFELKGAR